MKFSLNKTLITSASGILLLGIGLIGGSKPNIQNPIQNAESHIEEPVSHADNDNSITLSKKVTSKQFTGVCHDSPDGDIDTDSGVNKRLSKRVDHYLRAVTNLSDYHVHISRMTTSASQGNSLDDSETVTITFIRK